MHSRWWVLKLQKGFDFQRCWNEMLQVTVACARICWSFAEKVNHNLEGFKVVLEKPSASWNVLQYETLKWCGGFSFLIQVSMLLSFGSRCRVCCISGIAHVSLSIPPVLAFCQCECVYFVGVVGKFSNAFLIMSSNSSRYNFSIPPVDSRNTLIFTFFCFCACFNMVPNAVT